MSTRPHARTRVAARDLVDAAARLAGCVILDLADLVVGPALYEARAEAFRTLDGDDLGDDDGTLVVLVRPGTARDLIAEHGTPGAAAAYVNRELRAAGVL